MSKSSRRLSRALIVKMKVSSVEELRQTLTTIGEKTTAHKLKEMIREADNDLDGRNSCK